jgi:hypothetical protein
LKDPAARGTAARSCDKTGLDKGTHQQVFCAPGVVKGMRGVLVVALVLSLFVAAWPSPAAAGSESMPEVRDAQGDVVRGNSVVSDDLARALDITSAWFSRDVNGDFWVHTKVLELAALDRLADLPGWSAQYAFSFAPMLFGPQYHVSATTSSSQGGQWGCEVQDAATGEWLEAGGYVDVAASIVHVRLPADVAAAVAASGRATGFSLQTWGDFDDDTAQTDDWATSPLPYTTALDTPQPVLDAHGLVPCGTSALVGGGPIQLSDPAGDATVNDQPARGDLANALDMTAVWYDATPAGDVWAHIKVASLRGLGNVVSNKHASLQYAAGFGFGSGNREFEARADTGGSDYSQPSGSWDCQVHDVQADIWPQTLGYIDLQNGTLHIQLTGRAATELADGKTATTLDAQAWGSLTSDGSQTDDWGSSKATFAKASLPIVAAPSNPALVPCGDSPALGPQPAFGADHPQVPDDRGDVMRDDQPVDDALAHAMDITGIWFTRDASGAYWSHMSIADLAHLDGLRSNAEASLQYATTFAFGSADRSYQVSATTGGSNYAANGEWRCAVEDTATDKWTETYGYIDAARGQIHVRLPSAPTQDLASGEKAHHLGGQAWASLHRGDPQTGDWAQSHTTFIGPELPVTAPPSGSELIACGDAPAPDASPAAAPLQAERGPAAPAGTSRATPEAGTLLLLGLVFAIARRRR